MRQSSDPEPESEDAAIILDGRKTVDEELAAIRKQNQKMASMFEEMKKAVAAKEKQVKKLLDDNKNLEVEKVRAQYEKNEA